MNKRNFLSLALAMSTLTLAGSLMAQTKGTRTPPTPAQMVANRVTRLTKVLTLTPAQQAQANTIFTTEATALTGLRTSMQTARTALETAVEANDSNAITAQANAIGSLTTQEVQATAASNAAFYAILTADQKTAYKEVGPQMFGGRGGPGGPAGQGFRGPRQ